MELKELIQPLRKWWWLILVAMLVAGGASFAATREQTPIYRTRTTFMVGSAIDNPNPRNNEFSLTQQLANTYADIIRRQPIRQATMEALGLSFLPEYTVRIVPQTQLIEVRVADTNPQRTQAVADELVRQLIQRSPGASAPEEAQRQEFINKQLRDLEAGIEETEDEIENQQGKLATLFSARDIADTQGEIIALQSKLSALRSNYGSLLDNTESGALNTITIVEPAELPIHPVANNNAMMIIIAVMIGFVLAATAAYALEYLDDTIRNPQDAQKALALSTLGTIPYVKGAKDQNVVLLDSSQPLAADAYRVLRTNLRFASVDHPLKRLLITSPTIGEGKSATTANLGVALAQTGQKVIIVDADQHRPTMHLFFKLQNTVGLTTAIVQNNPDMEALLSGTNIPNLRVLTSGPTPPNPADLLSSQRMRELMSKLEEMADIVIIDSPPAIVLSDAAILSTLTDGVLLVVKSGSTRREAALRSVDGLHQVNANIIGVVITHVPTSKRGYYSYHRKHNYYYRQDGKKRVTLRTGKENAT